MERKFDSELAGRIARRQRNPAGRRATLLLMAVVSSAIMVGAAAVLTMKASAALGGPTEYIEALSSEDYLVQSEEDPSEPVYADMAPLDGTYLVKRASSLKYVEFDTPGQSPNIYTKFVYNVNIKLRDLSAFEGGVTGMSLSTVTVGGLGDVAPLIVTAIIAVDGTEVFSEDGTTPLEMSAYISWTFSEGVASVEVSLPDLTGTNIASYESGDMVSVFLMWKAPISG